MKKLLLVCLLLSASRLEAAYTTPAQHATMTTEPGAPVTLAFGGNVTSGNLIVVVQQWGAGSGTFIPTKSAGTATISAFSVDKPSNDATNGQSIGIASALVTGTGSLTIQGDDAAHSAFTSIEISEWAGNAAASPSDVFNGAVTTSLAPTTGAITTTVNGDLLISGFTNDAGSATYTVGAGWTVLDNSGSTNPNTLFVQYQVQGSSGAITGAAVQSAAQQTVAVIGSYKPSGGGGVTCGARALIGVGC